MHNASHHKMEVVYISGVSKFIYKGPESKYFRLCTGHMVSVATVQLCCSGSKGAISDMKMNKCGCVPIKLHLLTLKFEFHIIYVS